METLGLLDNRNLSLWDTLTSVQDIEIQKEKRVDYLVFSKNDKSIIYVPFDNINASSFTHELLHIYLRTKQVFIGAGLKNSIKENKVLSRIFSDKLLEHVGNSLDHIKMFPEFIRLGYSRDEFLSDFSVNKLTDESLSAIRKHFTAKRFFKKVYNSTAIDFFIGVYFAANACPNESFDYKKQLIELKKIDSDLFQILDNFLNAWINFDYNDTDPITSSYHTFLFQFVGDMENWTNGKTIK